MEVFDVAMEAATRAGTFFYHIRDGLHYHRNRVDAHGCMFLKCVQYEKGCRGRATLNGEDGFKHMKAHNHNPDMLYPAEMAMRRAVLARCKSLECISFRCILDAVGLRFPAEVRERVTLSRMRSPMRVARLKRFPAPPADLRALTQLLMDPQYAVLTMTSDGEDNLYAGSVEDADGGHHVVFASRRQLDRLRHHFRKCHSDGTFKTVPVNKHFAAQVYIICCVWRSTILYVAWVLMESRTESAYRAVLQFIWNRTGPTNLDTNIGDFEVAPHNAWEDVFDVNTQGCLWHFCRALIQHVGSLHLIPWMRQFREVRDVIQMCMALPMLPLNLMVEGFCVVVAFARHQGMIVLNLLTPFLTYVWDQWLKRDWMKRRVCVFRSKQRTNNVSESGNKALNEQVGVHPGVYKFIDGVVRLEDRHNVYWRILQQGRNPTRARKRTSILNDERIMNLTDDLEDAPGPVEQAVFRFLRAACHLMDNMVDGAIEDLPE